MTEVSTLEKFSSDTRLNYLPTIQVTPAGGLHSSAGGLHSSAGGLHSSAGGLHSSAGGLHSSAGGLRSSGIRSTSPTPPTTPSSQHRVVISPLLQRRSSFSKPVSTEPFKSPRDLLNQNATKIKDKKALSNWLNGELLYVNNSNPFGIEYQISVSNSLDDKYMCYKMAKKNRHIVKNIEEDDYVLSYHSVILFTLHRHKITKRIGYILISMDHADLYLYDLFMKDKYRVCPESLVTDDPTTSSKTLYNRFIAEFNKFTIFCNVRVICNPILAFPRIKELIDC